MTRICTNEEIKEMVQKVKVMARKVNVKPSDNAFKYMEILPLYQAGWSQKHLKEAGRELFHKSYDGKTFRKYLKECEIKPLSAGHYIKRRNLKVDTGQEILHFTDMKRCVDYLRNLNPDICEESIRKNIEKVLSDNSPQFTYKGCTISQLPIEDVRPDLKDTLQRIHKQITA